MQLFGNSDRRIAYWLIIVAITIYATVILGGVTRLSGAGLSIVKWDPIMGAIPPLSHQEWESTFHAYQQYPEYKDLNRNMGLPEFKRIFAFEYAHRLLGRSIGLVFLIPFLFFFFRKQIKPSLTPKLVIMFILGGLQGLFGWFMVKSGLVDQPNVSQFWLAAHLMTAILIYCYVLWTAWGLLYPTPRNAWAPKIKRLRIQMRILTGVILLMIVSGAFVAGTHAGAVFKTFPDMGGHLFPPGLFSLTPFFSNFVNNTTMIQFVHRLIAYIIVVFLILSWYQSHHYTLTSSARNAINLLLVVMIIQVTLGISTLLSVPDVPNRGDVVIWLASLHQGGALLLLTVALFINHELRKGN